MRIFLVGDFGPKVNDQVAPNRISIDSDYGPQIFFRILARRKKLSGRVRASISRPEPPEFAYAQ